jgi:hypothetical protein
MTSVRFLAGRDFSLLNCLVTNYGCRDQQQDAVHSQSLEKKKKKSCRNVIFKLQKKSSNFYSSSFQHVLPMNYYMLSKQILNSYRMKGIWAFSEETIGQRES